jgi:hypothetical protein
LSSSIRTLVLLGLWFGAGVASAQDQPPPQSLSPATWQVALDGVFFATLDRQGGQRGDTALTSQNWLMASAARPVKTGTLRLTAMMSAEPLTIGAAGYPQLFQEGETYRHLQITDRQHPHDLFMQLSAAWRQPIGARTAVSVSGGPVGEAALGPVAFMHRPSASENPSAPLTHHIFDSTHIVDGVVTLGADRGPLAIEASFFRGREPDEHRYDLEFGALDSWSARVWFRPTPAWSVQLSHGLLHAPEALEPGDQRRTNASVSWLRQADESHVTAVTGAVGRTVRTFSTLRGVLLEATHRAGNTSWYGRYEDRTLETEILLFPQIVHVPHPGELVDPIQALTIGMVQDFAEWRGFRVGGGADIVFHHVPELLEFTHGANVRSGHVFIRVRPSRGQTAHVH